MTHLLIARLLTVALLAMPGILLAQPNDVAARHCSFDASSRQHRSDQQRIGALRGGASAFRTERLLPTEAGETAPALGQVKQWLGQRVADGTYPAGTHVLFYARRAEVLCSWLIDPSGIVAVGAVAGAPERLRRSVWNAMGALEVVERQVSRMARRTGGSMAVQPPPAPAPAASHDEALRALSDLLFPSEIASALAPIRHLVVVPTDNLGTIPYPALSPQDDRRPIVERFSLSIAPSLQSLAVAAGRWNAKDSFRHALVVGDPHLAREEGWEVPPLPGAEAEARGIGSMLRTRPLLHSDATKSRVVAAAGDASLLWIATHGIASEHDGVNGAFLMLSAPRLEEGWWTAREIQSARLGARLAVLSACQTGLGQSHEGGMIGLARAFQLAGVPRVMMSLWNVDDVATQALMTRFVHHARSHAPSEALRRAMLDVRKTHPHPTLWASFLLFGEAA